VKGEIERVDKIKVNRTQAEAPPTICTCLQYPGDGSMVVFGRLGTGPPILRQRVIFIGNQPIRTISIRNFKAVKGQKRLVIRSYSQPHVNRSLGT
jgi:hypothetical protein